MNLIILTICYNKFSILEKSINNFYQQKVNHYEHYLIDNNYPYGNSEKLKKLCGDKKIHYLNFGSNIGLFNSMNKIIDFSKPNDLILLHEGNNIILDHGFDENLIIAYDSLKEEKRDILISLSNEFSDKLIIHQKNEISYSIENNGDTDSTKKPVGFPYGGINLTNREFLIKVSNFFKDVYFNDPYITYERKNRIVYILRSHREISHAFYEEENIEYKLYKMITVLLGYKKSFENFLELCDENIEYINMMANKLKPGMWKYIGYDPNIPIVRSHKDE